MRTAYNTWAEAWPRPRRDQTRVPVGVRPDMGYCSCSEYFFPVGWVMTAGVVEGASPVALDMRLWVRTGILQNLARRLSTKRKIRFSHPTVDSSHSIRIAGGTLRNSRLSAPPLMSNGGSRSGVLTIGPVKFCDGRLELYLGERII